MTIQKITDVKNIETTQEQWWMLYNDYTKIVIEPPMQCSGYTTSPHIMVIADTEEELLLFIEDNDLIILNDDAELT